MFPFKNRGGTMWLFACFLVLTLGGIMMYRPVQAQAPHAVLTDKKINSATNIKADIATIRDQIKILRTIYELYPDSARKIAYTVLHQSAAIAFPEGIVAGNSALGWSSQNNGQYDSSIFFFTRGLIAAKQSGRPVAMLYNNIANSYFLQGSYQRAMDVYRLALASDKPRSGDSSQVYLNMALTWMRLGSPDQAKECLKSVGEIAFRTKDTLRQIDLYTEQGGICMDEKKIQEGMTLYEKALNLALVSPDKGKAVGILNSLTHAALDLNQVDKAMLYTHEALDILKQYPGSYNYNRYHTQHNLGLIYSHLKNYQYAEQLLSGTYDIVEKKGIKDLMLHMEPDLAAVYAKNGKTGLAYEHMLHYAKMKDSLLDHERRSMLDLWQKNIVAEKDKAILNQKLHITDQGKKLQLKNTWMVSMGIIAILLSFLFIMGMRGYQRKRKLQEEQVARLEQSAEINQLKAQVKGEERERSRLALELHDGIASQLWAIKLNVETMQQAPADEYNKKLDMIYQQLDNATQEVRKTAHNLLPDLLLQHGLSTALVSICDKINAGSSINVNFQEYGIIPRMNEEIELSLYRMIQELIQNVLKHASGASHLLIQVSCMNNLLNITIEDNGAGFSMDELNKKGIGLHNIEKRVSILGGHFDIRSIPGRGTTAYLEFDIQHLL